MIGKILGPLQVERTLPGAENIRWVQVVCGERVIEAVDPVGTSPGETVLLCRGSAAARLAAECPAEAAVTAILESEEKEVDRSEEKRL